MTTIETTNVAELKTKGNAVISPAQVLEARTYLFNNPGTSAAKVRTAVGMDHMSLQAFDRTLRGIYHSHLDMCGLPVRLMTSKPETMEKLEAKKAAKAAARAERALTATRKLDVTGLTDEQIAEVQALIDLLRSQVSSAAAEPEVLAENPQTEEPPVDAEYVDMEDRAAAEAEVVEAPAAEPEVVEPEVAEPQAEDVEPQQPTYVSEDGFTAAVEAAQEKAAKAEKRRRKAGKKAA